MVNSLAFAVVTIVIVQQAVAAEEELHQIVISPEDVLVYHGQTIMFPCVAYFHSNSTAQPTISWMKDGTPLVTDDNSRITPHTPTRSDVGGVQFVRGLLEVCNVRVEDTGRYSCVLSVDDVEKDREDFEVTVTTYDAPTRVIVAPNDTEVPINQTVLLTCVAYALPTPTISWTRNNERLMPTAGSKTTVTIESVEIVRGGVRMVRSTLEMCGVNYLFSGEYMCTADNGLTSNTTSFQVTIDGPLRLLAGPSSPDVQVGANLSLTCDFYSTPGVTVSWSGVPLTLGGRFDVQEMIVREEGVEFVRSVLSVSPVADYDGGWIECIASNGGDELRHSFQLTVRVPPQILVSPPSVKKIVNQTLLLACVAHGASRLVWQREGLDLTSGRTYVNSTILKEGREFQRSVLELCGVGVAESGKYSCVAESEMGRDVASFDLCVVEPTGLLIAPSNVTIETGHTLSVACVGYTTQQNAQRTSLYWTNHNQQLVNSSKVTILETEEVRVGVALIRSILLVECVDHEDTVQYGCHVISDDVIRSAEFSVTVQVPPRFKEVSDVLDYSVPKEGTISFTCLAGGDPLPTISWFKDGSFLSPDLNKRVEIRETSVPGFSEFDMARESMLTIQSVTEADAGEYRCQASSTAGTAVLGTPYQLIVDLTIDDPEAVSSIALGIGHGSYLGSIVGFLCFLAVFVVYVAIRSLRKQVSTPTLVNVCLSLMALNLSHIVSYNTTQTGVGCIFFAGVFQYFFLAAVLSLTVLVAFKAKQKKDLTRRMFIHMIAFSLNWGVPLVVVILSLSPDVTNYVQPEAGHYCVPTEWPYWLGELLPLALIHLPTWCAFFAITFFNKSKNGHSQWLWDTLSTASLLLLFDITWAIGLPSTQQTNTVLHSFFLILSAVFGIIAFVIYCFGYPETRYEIMSRLKCLFPKAKTTPVSDQTISDQTPPSSGERPADPINSKVEMIDLDDKLSLSGIEAGKVIQEKPTIDNIYEPTPQPRAIITSFSDSVTDEELGLVVNQRGTVSGRRGSVRDPEEGRIIQEKPMPQPRAIITSISESLTDEEPSLVVNGRGTVPGRRGSVRDPEEVEIKYVVRYNLV